MRELGEAVGSGVDPSKTVDSQGKNKAAAISKQAKKINIKAEPVAKDSSQQNDVKAEPVAKDSTQQNDSQNSIKRRRSTKDTIILKYKSISFAEQVKYYLITVALCSIPFVTYGLAFTQIGYGIQLLQFLKENSTLSMYALGGGLLIPLCYTCWIFHTGRTVGKC